MLRFGLDLLGIAIFIAATIATTGNDESNAPMLAVNTKLGYRPFARHVEWERVTAAG